MKITGNRTILSVVGGVVGIVTFVAAREGLDLTPEMQAQLKEYLVSFVGLCYFIAQGFQAAKGKRIEAKLDKAGKGGE